MSALLSAPSEPTRLMLVSHHLCPYVQRAAISLAEKGVPFERLFIDLADKPAWFLEISPLGKTPVLVSAGVPIFESAPILEYLEETQPRPMHPSDPLQRARHRAWIEFGSSVLNDIAGLYNAPDRSAFEAKSLTLGRKFDRLDHELGAKPYFAGAAFSLVDAVFGPVFRYFDVFDTVADFGILTGRTNVARWRAALAERPSIAGAVSADYSRLLLNFLSRRGGFLSSLVASRFENVAPS